MEREGRGSGSCLEDLLGERRVGFGMKRGENRGLHRIFGFRFSVSVRSVSKGPVRGEWKGRRSIGIVLRIYEVREGEISKQKGVDVHVEGSS